VAKSKDVQVPPVSWRNLLVVGSDGEVVRDDVVRAHALAAALAIGGPVAVALPEGVPVGASIDWTGIEAIEASGAQAPYGVNSDGSWATAAQFDGKDLAPAEGLGR
jgi:hypothetical protein